MFKGTGQRPPKHLLTNIKQYLEGIGMIFERLREEYIKVLDEKPDNYFDGGERKSGQEIADKMFKAINESKHPSDWLRQNKALKEACKVFNISKSGELRELVKSHFENFEA